MAAIVHAILTLLLSLQLLLLYSEYPIVSSVGGVGVGSIAPASTFMQMQTGTIFSPASNSMTLPPKASSSVSSLFSPAASASLRSSSASYSTSFRGGSLQQNSVFISSDAAGASSFSLLPAASVVSTSRQDQRTSVVANMAASNLQTTADAVKRGVEVREYSLVMLPGDGIGPEVMAEVHKLIDWIHRTDTSLRFTIEEDLIGGASLNAHGVPLTVDTLAKCQAADAVLLGAVGGPQWDDVPYQRRPESGLLELREALGVFANLRPAVLYDPLIHATPLKPEVVRGLDIVFVRELVGGIYFGEPRGITDLGNGERRAVDTQVYTTSEIRRIGRVAFELARKRKNRVCSVSKSNVMMTGRLWKQEITRLHEEEYKDDVELTHMLADNCAMQLIANPRQFDVLVTDNLFGDLLSDESAMLTGSLGMLRSASLGEVDQSSGKRKALYEPCHGSAPDIAGKQKANPLATILSFSMCLKYSFNEGALADRIESAVEAVLAKNYRTADIMPPKDGEGGVEGAAAQGILVSTAQMGDLVVRELEIKAAVDFFQQA